MIDIPIGKALIAEERDADAPGCKACFFFNVHHCSEKIACRSHYRPDGKT